VRARIRAQAADANVNAIVLDAESTPFIDVTAAHMLVELADDLERSGVRFAVARSIGNVRDVLDRAEPEAAIWPTYPDVGAAVDALTRADPLVTPAGPT
jgi:SulP family sulfate permease